MKSPRYCLADLFILVEIAFNHFSESSSSFAIGFIDLEEAFKSSPYANLLQVILMQYSIDLNTIKYIRKMYQNTTGHVIGAKRLL